MRRSELFDDHWMSHSCHVHAVACNAVHGGDFAILYDFHDAGSDDGSRDPIPCVWHVWSVHETSDGLIARDVTGDTPVDELPDRADLLWPDDERSVKNGEIHLNLHVTLSDLIDLISDKDHPFRTLDAISHDEINEAVLLESVQAMPGSRPAIEIEDDQNPSVEAL